MIFYSKDEERAVYEAMHGYQLKPGQALWLGPRSIAVLAGREQHKGGPLPDRLILDQEEWRGD